MKTETYTLSPLVTRWRFVGENRFQFEATGGKLICPAVLACCGPSEKAEHDGEFWWNARSTPKLPRTETAYVATLEAAEQAAEAHLAGELEDLRAPVAGENERQQ